MGFGSKDGGDYFAGVSDFILRELEINIKMKKECFSH